MLSQVVLMSRFVLLFLLTASVVVSAQQPAGPSAQALFEKGMNAMTSANDTNALDCFHRSADLGYAPAQDMMGYFTQTGTLTLQEPGEAASWYKKAAQQGDRLAQW